MSYSSEAPTAAVIFQHAMQCMQSGDIEQATLLCRRYRSDFPADIGLLNLSGILELQQGNCEEAVSLLGRSLRLAPNQPQIASNMGIGLEKLGHLKEALISFNHAITLAPTYAKAHCNRSNVLNELQRYEEAVASARQALVLDPNMTEACCSCGNALRDLGRLEEALNYFDRAIALSPRTAILYGNRGNTLRDMYRPEEALADFEVAVTLDPNNTNLWINRGNVLRELKCFADARSSYARAMEAEPENGDAHWDIALIDLLTGDFTNGWDGYEWRWQSPSLAHAVRPFTQPLWTGQPDISGKTILIHAEQGLGDTVQFARYIPMVHALGAKVICEAPATLIDLLQSMPETELITWIEAGSPLPDFDLHCPTMSLPRAFSTQLETIPADIPYLSASADKMQYWQEKLGTKKARRIGLVFSGKRGMAPDRKRSIPAKLFEPIFSLPFEFHCLQQDIREDDSTFIGAYPQIHSHSTALSDFSDTAALIANMDLVISVDTAIAHVTGALGKPLWLLLPAVPDWRWMMDRTDTPWYPGARLFRQTQNGNWQDVILALCHELTQIPQHSNG